MITGIVFITKMWIEKISEGKLIELTINREKQNDVIY